MMVRRGARAAAVCISWDFTPHFSSLFVCLFVCLELRSRTTIECACGAFVLFRSSSLRFRGGFSGIWGFLREGLSPAILPGFFAREFRRCRVFPSSQHAARAPPPVSALRIPAISLSSSLLLLSNLCFFTPPPRLIPAGRILTYGCGFVVRRS